MAGDLIEAGNEPPAPLRATFAFKRRLVMVGPLTLQYTDHFHKVGFADNRDRLASFNEFFCLSMF